MPLKVRDVIRALTKKGFREAEGDHRFYFLWHNGRRTAIRTKISHGESEIHDKNCGSMARQIKLNRSEFDEFVECPLTAELYVELLIRAKHLDPPQKT